jgi:acetylornithine deacetylase/succinyl-diaminopimelate desuccinylase-like protein
MSNLGSLREHFKFEEKQALKDYFTFLGFQSISSEPSYKGHVEACAAWLMQYLQKMGFDTQLWPTSGHPVIFASNLKAGPEKPTLLIYNHYDVQPVDPLNEWLSPPFEPTVKEGQVYARGAQDNKGQCFYTLLALKALLGRDKELPVNIKLCIEGEEECGSQGLSKILSQKKKELKADYLAIVDVGLHEPTVPAVTLGVRGIVTMDVEVQGTNTDLHSGSHGGLAYNPIHALIEILAKTHNQEGQVAIPGFYDDVVTVSSKERSQLALEFDEKKYISIFGAPPTGGEKAYSPSERAWLRPTLEVNGIHGGYSGAGFKTVIPAKASAKVSCRLVPNQEPQKIAKLVAQFIESQAPKGIQVKVHIHPGGGKAVRANPQSEIVQAFAKAYSEVFQAPCEFIFEGGSIPVVTELAQASGSEVVLVGLGLADDKIHAPNEHFGLDRIEKGFLVIARTLELLGKR